jgi:class 3 adenylate cyclase
VVTFLFTDVEGSTRRWEEDADGMRKALAAHDEVLRKSIETHDGAGLPAMSLWSTDWQEGGPIAMAGDTEHTKASRPP